MTQQKRSYKNPYHQTQSEHAEWLALFAQDYSTAEVADALVERYPERSTGDPKADRRLAKEAICTVNPNDSRYNAEKWAKQCRLIQANYISELEKCHRQLISKSVTALNAVYDDLESTISSLSPKERLTLLPKALLTLNQAVRSLKVPPPLDEQAGPDDLGNPDEHTALEAQSVEPQESLDDALEIISKVGNLTHARDMIRDGKNLDEITAETGVTVDDIKEMIKSERVEHEVLGMYKNGMPPSEIQNQTNLDLNYIDSIIDDVVLRRFYGAYVGEPRDPAFHNRTRALLKNGDGEDLDSDLNTVRRLN